jgi:hypothetical protein
MVKGFAVEMASQDVINHAGATALRISAGSNTTTDHLEVLDEVIRQIPARYRRDLLITVDGADASHGLANYITRLNATPGRRVHHSIGWELGARERQAIVRLPASTWGAVLDTEGQPPRADRSWGRRADRPVTPRTPR